MTSTSSITTFIKGMEAPCVRFVLTDGGQLVLPYLHASSFELSAGGKLLICQFGETQLQIEGERLLQLLVDLQRNAVDLIEAATREEAGLPHVSRVVRVELEIDPSE